MDDEQQMMEGGQEAGGTELNPTNAFGELLLDLIEAQFEGDIDAGIQALVQATGLGEEEVTAIISGESIVDDPDVLEAIVGAFPDANDDDIETIIEVASGVEEEDRKALEAQYDNDDDGDAEGGVDPMAQQGADYAANYNQANFNRSVASEIQKLKQEKAQLEAHFANREFTAELSAHLSDLDARLSEDVANGELPPSVKEALIGNFANANQRVAQFSAITESNGARDLREQLYASEFAYSLLKNVANVVQFTDFSISAEEAATANFSSSLEEAAKGDLVAMGLDFNSFGL